MDASFVPQSLRGLSEALGRIPSAREAFREFCTPNRIGVARRESEVMATSQPFSVDNSGVETVCHSWGSGPAVLVAHGWNARAATMTAFVEPLLEAGFRVVIPDHPAHGESKGETCNGFQVSLGLERIADEVGGFVGAVTHSFGSIGVNLFLHHGNTLPRVVHIAPFCSIIRRFYEFAQAVGLSEEGVREFMRVSNEFFGDGKLDAMDGALIAPEFRGTSALIIHDEGDQDIPVGEGTALARHWPGAQLLLTQGLGHLRIIRDRKTIAHSVAFLAHDSI
jgi:pimeloyl-ACP methyl ester carboxylesterase